jgi:hypothetical protein
MRDLQKLPPASVTLHATRNADQASITLVNTGKSVAFFLALHAIKDGTDQEITPIYWSDNYISLLPGEARKLTLRNLPASEKVNLTLAGWDLASTTHPLMPEPAHHPAHP